ITGGAGTQQITLVAVDARFSRASSEPGRWLIQIWSWESTKMPPMVPMIQLFGSGCGQVGSTWNFGGSAKAGRSSAAATKPIKAILGPIPGISASHFLRLDVGCRSRGCPEPVNRFHEPIRSDSRNLDPMDLILRSALLGARLEGWPLALRLWPSFETRARAAALDEGDDRIRRYLSGRRRRQPLEHELLHPVALGFAGHEIAVGIDPEAVQVEELAGLAAGAADMADLFEGGAIQDGDAFVRAVGDVKETLFRIGRQRNAECRASSLRFPLHEPFLHEGAVQLERLDAVVGAVRDVNDAVIGDGDAVRRVELLRSRTGNLARFRSLVVGLV